MEHSPSYLTEGASKHVRPSCSFRSWKELFCPSSLTHYFGGAGWLLGSSAPEEFSVMYGFLDIENPAGNMVLPHRCLFPLYDLTRVLVWGAQKVPV